MVGETVDNAAPTWYIRGMGLLWSKNSSGNTTYLYNAHGDVVKTTGAAENDYLYDAFGNQVDEQTNQPFEWRVDEPPMPEADYNPFRYCGEYFDYETGYIYLRARYYDSSNGRFISEDPIRSGNNWYAYCAGNPIRFSDPLGLYVTEDPWGNPVPVKPTPKPPSGGSGGDTTLPGGTADPTNPAVPQVPAAPQAPTAPELPKTREELEELAKNRGEFADYLMSLLDFTGVDVRDNKALFRKALMYLMGSALAITFFIDFIFELYALRDAGETMTVRFIASDHNGYGYNDEGNNKAIHWNPNLGHAFFQNNRAEVQSAAMALYHEMRHAYAHMQGGRINDKDLINNYETPLAQALNDVSRSNHTYDGIYYFYDPTVSRKMSFYDYWETYFRGGGGGGTLLMYKR